MHKVRVAPIGRHDKRPSPSLDARFAVGHGHPRGPRIGSFEKPMQDLVVNRDVSSKLFSLTTDTRTNKRTDKQKDIAIA